MVNDTNRPSLTIYVGVPVKERLRRQAERLSTEVRKVSMADVALVAIKEYLERVERQQDAEQIVRLLAAYEAPLVDGTYANGHDWCIFCAREGAAVEAHDPECPWRLARESVAQ